MSSRELACPGLSPARRAADLPPGPVQLWIIIVSAGDQPMGAAQITEPLQPSWKDGKLHIGYGRRIKVLVEMPGWYDRAYLVAVSGQSWRPVARISLGPSQEVRRGDDITVCDGKLAMDFSGGPNDPWLS